MEFSDYYDYFVILNMKTQNNFYPKNRIVNSDLPIDIYNSPQKRKQEFLV